MVYEKNTVYEKQVGEEHAVREIMRGEKQVGEKTGGIKTLEKKTCGRKNRR